MLVHDEAVEKGPHWTYFLVIQHIYDSGELKPARIGVDADFLLGATACRRANFRGLYSIKGLSVFLRGLISASRPGAQTLLNDRIDGRRHIMPLYRR